MSAHAHSMLAPSSASVWGPADGCPGSVFMEMQFPEDTESEYAREGEAAHEFGADLINAVGRGRPTHTNAPGYLNAKTTNGVHLNLETLEAAQMYAEDVERAMLRNRVFGGPNIGVEVKVTAPRVHSLSHGTPDCWLYDSKEKTLYVWDFKFGFGVVEAFENWQLINYVAGLLALLGIPDDDTKHTIVLTIVQPRAPHPDGPIRRWRSTVPGLVPYFEQLHTSAAIAMGKDPTTRTGAHCRYCRARGSCATLQRAGSIAMAYAAAPRVDRLTPENMAVEVDALERAAKTVEYRLTGLRTEAEGLLRRGVALPGLAMVPSRGTLRWTQPTEHVLTLGTVFGVNLDKKQPLTPTQAIAAGVPEDAVAGYAARAPGKTKLKIDKGTKARMIFGGK